MRASAGSRCHGELRRNAHIEDDTAGRHADEKGQRKERTGTSEKGLRKMVVGGAEDDVGSGEGRCSAGESSVAPTAAG